MICAIHQPQFIPWLGYLHKILSADVFVFLDDVQFKKNEFQNRNRMLMGAGVHWATVPVSFHFGDAIHAVKVSDDHKWRQKLIRTITLNYQKAAHFETFMPEYTRIIEQKWPNLAELNIASVLWLLEAFEIPPPAIYRSSQWQGLSADPTGRLIDICKTLDADTYLSGAGGKGYLDTAQFASADVTLTFQDFTHPVYPQKINKGAFVPYLSALDGLFHCGGGPEARHMLGLM